MLRNYLAAALRSLLRNKIVAAINIVGLAIGLAAAILIGLYVRYELSYESFIPEHERIYRISGIEEFSSNVPVPWDSVGFEVASELKNDFPEIELTARIADGWMSVRRGEREYHEQVFTADPDFFRIFRVKAIAGDLPTALDAPDAIVISRTMARKYFSKDAPLGEVLEVYRSIPLRVTAVIEDLPGNTHFNFGLIASGQASFSPIKSYESSADAPRSMFGSAHTYFRLREGTSIARIESGLKDYIERHYNVPPSVSFVRLVVRPIHTIHLAPAGTWPFKPPGSPQALAALGIVAALIVLVAAINFVNLMTARAAERSIEVGVRKVTGARRRDLVVQFIGESFMYVLFAMLLAVALVELALPAMNAMLDPADPRYPAATITFPYWHDAMLATAILGAMLVLGLLAGAYPAFVLSALRPVAALKGNGAVHGGGWTRHGLVVVQFAILIGLIFATTVIHRQTAFALRDALRIDKDQVLLIQSYLARSDAFRQALASLPGVRGVTSSFSAPTNGDITNGPFESENGRSIQFHYTTVDFNFFEFYGLRPIAGRLFSRERTGDLSSRDTPGARWTVVINETGARALGYAHVEDAVGAVLTKSSSEDPEPVSATVIGVVPDFPVDSIREPIDPTIYLVDPTQLMLVSVRLTGTNLPETLEAIDEVWAQLGEPRAISRWFLDQHYESMYRDVLQQRKLLSALSVIAVLIACLGLFGLSIFMAQRRTKEIGVRKALGAERSDILALLLWSFSKPVLWANVLAWPIAAYAMHRWLNGFAYRVELGWWLLPIASLVALIIALATVSAHSYLVARSRPVDALRYE